MNKFLTILLCTAFALASCQSEEEQQPTAATGTIVLSLGGTELYTELQTRAEVPVADLSKYVFTISGTTISGATVTDLVLEVEENGTAKVNAGTYTLTADNAAAANQDHGRPYYHGTSAEFTIRVNEETPVSIALGKPKNARIMLAYNDSFTALYENPVVTLADNDRSVTLTSTEEVCYFIIPASGALAYTITADAKENSNVTDIKSHAGWIDIAAGYNTTITLKANPVSGEIIPIIEGNHNGTFD